MDSSARSNSPSCFATRPIPGLPGKLFVCLPSLDSTPFSTFASHMHLHYSTNKQYAMQVLCLRIPYAEYHFFSSHSLRSCIIVCLFCSLPLSRPPPYMPYSVGCTDPHFSQPSIDFPRRLTRMQRWRCTGDRMGERRLYYALPCCG